VLILRIMAVVAISRANVDRLFSMESGQRHSRRLTIIRQPSQQGVGNLDACILGRHTDQLHRSKLTSCQAVPAQSRARSAG
jgi:hypothetical protein